MPSVRSSRLFQFPTILALWVVGLLFFYVFYFGPYFASTSYSHPPTTSLRRPPMAGPVLQRQAEAETIKEWWRWEDGAHPPGRPEAPFPHGPWDDQFIEHITIDDDFTLAIDADKSLHYMKSGVTDVVRWSERALQFKRDWLMRIVDFRHFMRSVGMDNTQFNGVKQTPAVPTLESEGSPFFESYLRNEALFNETRHDVRPARNVVDHALIVPVTTERYDEAWVVFESIMQQVTFPKEIVVLLFKARGFYIRETFSFLTVLLDVYSRHLPDGVSMKVFVSPSAHCPGDTRWFGFNQTSASLVTFFDGDDYLHPQAIQILHQAFNERPDLHFGLAQYKGGNLEGKFNVRRYYDEIHQTLSTSVVTPEFMDHVLSFSPDEYRKLESKLPNWNKTWWLGNTDAEPNWTGEEQRWWDAGCHNGWSTLRRIVMKYAPPPTRKFGGEDAIFNYRVAKSGFNYHCLTVPVGMYVKCFCDGDRYLWKDEPEIINIETGETVSLEHLEKLRHAVEESMRIGVP